MKQLELFWILQHLYRIRDCDKLIARNSLDALLFMFEKQWQSVNTLEKTTT